MKKYIMAAVCLAAALTGARATTAVVPYFLCVNTNDGNTVKYEFLDTPVASFSGENMTITLATEEQIVFPMADVASITLLPDYSGVSEVSRPADILVSISRDMINISGLEAGTAVNVYDMRGAAVLAARADNDGNAALSTAALSKGVYVVSASRHSFKFIK